MTASTFPFAGLEVQAIPAGGLFMPACATLVLADLHLEKGSALARRGALLPPYDSEATLARLSTCLDALTPRRVICLGDSFHDGGGPARLTAADRRQLERLTAGCEWVWVAGNHDPQATEFVGGTVVMEAMVDGIAFRHQAQDDADGYEISGHFHPKACLTVNGRRITGRCFVTDGRRLILPAFGAYAGGLDVFDPVITALMAPSFQIHVIGYRRVHCFSSRTP